MPLDKLNAALIAAIQNGTPEYTNPAAILTDKLNIGREAAYRRLRGEVPFTFGEAAVLSAQMNFSLDRAVGAVDFGNVLFRVMMPKVVGVVLDQMTRIVRFWSFAFLNNSIIAVQEKIPLYKVLKMLFRESAMDS